eukprot:gene8750-33611_t
MVQHQLRYVYLVICWLAGQAEAISEVPEVLLDPSLTQDFNLSWAQKRWYNPSIVGFKDGYIASIKATSYLSKKGKVWWINRLYMCRGKQYSITDGLNCADFNPWPTEYEECEFGHGVRGGKVDTSGLGDVKLWHWPGKGVYAIFGRKPERGTSKFCKGPIIYHQWVYQVVPDKAALGTDPWHLPAPVPLLPPANHSYPANNTWVSEKNWMPFLYTDADGLQHLYCAYYVQPHVILEIFPDGSTASRWTTHNKTLMAPFKDFSVHGGPPIIFVPANLSADRQAHYLGIMHHIEKSKGGRLYRHFAYKISPLPPFNILAVSDELPVVYNKEMARTAWVIFVNGLYMSEEGTVVISYGAADAESRVLMLPIKELERLFTGNVRFRTGVGPSSLS